MKEDHSYEQSRQILGQLFLHEEPLRYGKLKEAAQRSQKESQREQILMCKNAAVYNITTGEVYHRQLLPGCMLKTPCEDSFRYWMKQRYSSGTNTLARQLRGIVFGQGRRDEINERTRALSFTDCYWIKEKQEEIRFEEVSPYYTDFWDGRGAYSGRSIPTLYVAGALAKEWRRDGSLYKQGHLQIELECIELCKLAGIPVEDGFASEDGICLRNFTSPDHMLEQMNESGKMDPEEFASEDIVRLFGIDGIRMLTIDAIVGNGDRHSGNFGFLRDADTGEYIGMAPLYDFDHALDTARVDRTDRLMEDALFFAKGKDAVSSAYRDEIRRICACAQKSSNRIFRARAKRMHDILTDSSALITELPESQF